MSWFIILQWKVLVSGCVKILYGHLQCRKLSVSIVFFLCLNCFALRSKAVYLECFLKFGKVLAFKRKETVFSQNSTKYCPGGTWSVGANDFGTNDFLYYCSIIEKMFSNSGKTSIQKYRHYTNMNLVHALM